MKLLLFCGPSGSGKTTIVHYLLKQFPQLIFSVSATTRSKRLNEADEVDYHFISVEDFKKKIAHDAFVEWEEVYPNGFYGTLKSEIENIAARNKIPVFDVDVEGGLNIKKFYGDQLLSVFVMPPSIAELKKRLHARASETPESFQKRIEKASHELTYADKFDKVIINIKLEDSCKEASQLAKDFLNA